MLNRRFNSHFLSPTKTHVIHITKISIIYQTIVVYLENKPKSKRHAVDEIVQCLVICYYIKPLNPELNPICYFLALLGAHHFLYVSRIRVKLLTFRLLMSYIYGAPILDVSRSHTTTQHSR